MNNEALAHLVIINQMATTTGCTHEQAKQFLLATEWRLEVRWNFSHSLSLEGFFDSLLGSNSFIFR